MAARALTLATFLGTVAAQKAGVPQGVEFTCAPFCTADVVGSGDGRDWVSPYNTSAKVPIDARGWPRADFYAVIFDNRAWRLHLALPASPSMSPTQRAPVRARARVLTNLIRTTPMSVVFISRGAPQARRSPGRLPSTIRGGGRRR